MTQIFWGSKDHEINCPLEKTTVLVEIYNQEFHGDCILMVFDFQGNVLFGGEQASKDLPASPFQPFYREKYSCRFAVKIVGKCSKFLLHMMIEG